VLAVLALTAPHWSRAEQRWQFRPYLYAGEQYSDNIELAPSGGLARQAAGVARESSFVTTLIPGLSLQHNGPWRLSLDYRLQANFYEGGVSTSRFTNQLLFNTAGELIDKSVFLNVTANIGQFNNLQRLSSGRGRVFAVDNVSRTGNVNTFKTVRVNPYWQPHLGGYVEGTVGVVYTFTSTDGADQTDVNGIGEYVDLFNGTETGAWGWRLNFLNQALLQGAGNSATGDVTYRNYSGQIDYALFDHIRPFVQGGVFENDFAGAGNLNGANNGGYWNAGLIWTPSRKTSLQAGVGPDNYFVTFNWSPSRKTDVFLTFRDSDVGGAYGGTAGFGGLGAGGLGGGAGLGSQGGLGGGYGPAGGSQALRRAGSRHHGQGDFGGACSLGSSAASGPSAGIGGADAGLLGNQMGGLGGAGLGGGVSGLGGGASALGSGMGGAGLGTNGFGGGVGALGVGVGGTGNALNQTAGFNAGTTWNGGICHRTRRTVTQVFYTEYTTTLAQIFQDTQQAFIGIGQPTNLGSLNQVIARRRGQANVSLIYPKTSFSLTGYQERSSFGASGSQDTLGVAASWNWRFAHRTSAQLLFAWQSADANPATGIGQRKSSTDFTVVSLGVYHTISKHLSGGLIYRYTDQSSDFAGGSFNENRVMASLALRY
jgi:hypothetical protein